MPAPTAPATRRQPTWRRLVTGTLALFFVVLALLVGRVKAGADPGLTDNKSQTTHQKQAATRSSSSSSSSSSPSSSGGYGAGSSSSSGVTDPSPPATQAS